MSTISDEALAKDAAVKSSERAKMQRSKMQMLPHVEEALPHVEKVRSLAEIIARKHGVDIQLLWKWIVRELTE